MDNFFNDEVGEELDKKSSAFYPLEEGQNKFRIVSNFAWGYKYDFKNRATGEAKNHPFYKAGSPEVKTERSKLVLTAMMAVYDYRTKVVMPFSVSQKNILNALREYNDNPKYGAPTLYDVVITRKGTGKDTKYPSVIADPPELPSKEVLEAVETVKINLDNVYIGEHLVEVIEK